MVRSQHWSWPGNDHLNHGHSGHTKRSVLTLLKEKCPNQLQLATCEVCKIRASMCSIKTVTIEWRVEHKAHFEKWHFIEGVVHLSQRFNAKGSQVERKEAKKTENVPQKTDLTHIQSTAIIFTTTLTSTVRIFPEKASHVLMVFQPCLQQ